MSATSIVINVAAAGALLFSLTQDRQKTMEALKTAGRSGIGLAPMLGIMLILIALLLGIMPPSSIESLLGAESGALGVLVAGALGSILHIPALLAFPLGGSLLRNNASVMVVAVFITTLTMVGFVTLPLEIQVLGKRFALVRTGLSLLAAFTIAILMGIVL